MAASAWGSGVLSIFQFETRCVSNHTACRFAEKTRFFRSLWAGRRCAAASHFAFFKGKMLYAEAVIRRMSRGTETLVSAPAARLDACIAALARQARREQEDR